VILPMEKTMILIGGGGGWSEPRVSILVEKKRVPENLDREYTTTKKRKRKTRGRGKKHKLSSSGELEMTTSLSSREKGNK